MMDEKKYRILEEAGFGKEFIKELKESDAALERAGITDEAGARLLQGCQKEFKLSSDALYLRNRFSYDFVIFCHWDESWRSRRKIKKELKGAIVGAQHIKACAKCQELLPFVIQNLQSFVQK